MADLDRTHSRIGYVAFGTFLILLGIIGYIITTLAIGLPVLALIVYGPLLLTGVLIGLATPVTGAITTKLRIYKAILLLPAIDFLVTGIYGAFQYREWTFGFVILWGIVLLGIYVRTSWTEMRNQLNRVRQADPKADVAFLPPETRTLALHLLVGTVSVSAAGIGLWLALFRDVGSPWGFGSVLLFSVLFAVSAPHTGSLRRKIWIYKALLIGPGLGLLIGGITSLAGGGSVIVSAMLIFVGAGALYLALVKVSWDVLRDAIETARDTGDVSWEAIREVAEEKVEEDDHEPN